MTDRDNLDEHDDPIPAEEAWALADDLKQPDQRPVEDHPLPGDPMTPSGQPADPMESAVCVACGGDVEWVEAVDGDGGWWDHFMRAAAEGPHRAVVAPVSPVDGVSAAQGTPGGGDGGEAARRARWADALDEAALDTNDVVTNLIAEADRELREHAEREAALVAESEALRAEVERLRAGIEALAELWQSVGQLSPAHRLVRSECAVDLLLLATPDAPQDEARLAYPADHGWTPHARFTTDRCRVTLARYPCPYGKDEHDPNLPPVDVDAFGYRRPDAAPQDEGAGRDVAAEIDALGVCPHENCPHPRAPGDKDCGNHGEGMF